jgi:hypothetical protein
MWWTNTTLPRAHARKVEPQRPDPDTIAEESSPRDPARVVL